MLEFIIIIVYSLFLGKRTMTHKNIPVLFMLKSGVVMLITESCNFDDTFYLTIELPWLYAYLKCVVNSARSRQIIRGPVSTNRPHSDKCKQKLRSA